MTATTANQSAPQHEAYISKMEVARRLGRGERTIENYMRRGWLPYYKIGRAVHFKWSEVEAHLGQNYHVNHNQS